jgi:preprotein translocase subunit Sec61beta
MKEPGTRHLGELAIDLAIVAGSALYVHAADAYPPQGRQIPRLVGYLALAMGVLHLVAHVVPRLWAVTHDSQAGGAKEPGIPAQATVAAGPVQEPSGQAEPGQGTNGDGGSAPTALQVPPGDPRQVVLAMAWVAGLLLAVWVLGFVVAIPVFFLGYFAALRAWRTAVVSAVAMWAVAWGLFEYALAVPLPHGLL